MRRTFVLVMAALFERQLRTWLSIKPAAKSRKIESVLWPELIEIVGGVDKSITADRTMSDLDEMHLVANAVRHGNGQSARKLVKQKAEFWQHLNGPVASADPIGDMPVSDDHLFRYRKAAALFWYRAGASRPPF